jgi:hypothetical protein
MVAISRVAQVLYREFRKDQRDFAAFRRWRAWHVEAAMMDMPPSAPTTHCGSLLLGHADAELMHRQADIQNRNCFKLGDHRPQSM